MHCSSPKEREALRLKVKMDSIQTRLAELKQRKLELIFNRLAEKELFNGNVLIAENGKFLLKKSFGYADFSTKTPLQLNSTFRIAGLTQSFTALAAMLLIEEKKISYEDSLKKFFPEIPFSGVKIRHLLTHTSGIPDYLSFFYNTSTRELPYANNQNVMDWLINTQPDAEYLPGRVWSYSSTNYVLLANIIEQVSRLKLKDFFKIKFFTPLKMQDSFLPDYNQPIQHPHRALGFSGINGKLQDDNALNYIYGDNGLYTSVEDLYKWEQALYNSKKLKINDLSLAFQPTKLENDTYYPYGLGWHLRDKIKIILQQGAWLGFQGAMMRVPDKKITIIILSNCQNPIFLKIVEMTQNLMLGLPYEIPQ